MKRLFLVLFLLFSNFTQFFKIPSGQNYEFLSRSTGITTSSTQGTFGSFTQITASASHSIVQITGVIEPTATTGKGILLGLATGAMGSEVVKVAFSFTSDQVNVQVPFSIDVDSGIFSKGTRISVATANETDTTQPIITASISLIEIND